MKSFTMKALAVAVLGLAGVGSAMAATCPTADQTKNTLHSPGGGGAWTSQFISNDGTLSVTSPGLNSTNCALSVSIGSTSNSRVFVQDSSPQNESRFRARFYISLANLVSSGSFNVSNQTAIVYRANDTSGPSQFTSDELVVRVVGAPSSPQVRFFVADANQGSGTDDVIVTLPTSATNTWRVEFDLQHGAGSTSTGGCNTTPASGGCFRYWVTDAATATSDTSPTGSITVNNAGWSGTKTAFLGLTTGTSTYRSNHSGTVIVEDEYDSRRQTFIGQ